MPRDDRYDDDDLDRPRRRGGVGGSGATVLYVLLGLGAAVVLGCGVLGFLIVREVREVAKEFKDGIRQAMPPPAGPAEFTLTAAELGTAYAAPAAADAKYLGKAVRLTGVVESSEGMDDFIYVVQLAPPGAAPTAVRMQCEFTGDRTAAAVGFQPGQTVTLVGVVEGLTDADEDDDDPKPNRPGKSVVRLDRCRLPDASDDAPKTVAPVDAPKARDRKAPAATGPAREQAPAPKKAADGDAP